MNKGKIIDLSQNQITSKKKEYDLNDKNICSVQLDKNIKVALIENEKGKTLTLRLSKIKNISIITKERTFTENSIAIFEKQIKYGIQYSILENENSIIKIRLTPKGIMLFDKLYVYRPVCEKIEGDIYYFNCSYSQIYQYFCRFGKHAIILEPEILVERLRDYYYIANKAYKKAHPYSERYKKN